MKNYLTYPCKTMRITQSYTGTTSHLPHTTGSPKDYPWDEGCTDSGRDYCYCPCGEMQVKRIYGVGTGGTNTMWLESTSKVVFADGTSDYFTMLITHPNDDELKKIKVGQKFKWREKICREGKDGATGNHFHFSAGKGKINGNGWLRNTNGKYILTTTAGQFKPEQLFFVDKSFTKIVNSKGLKFKDLPDTDKFFPAKGYFTKGDTHKNIGKIADFLYNKFLAGDYYGENIEALIVVFQKMAGIEADGNIGSITLSKLAEYGFKY